MQARYTINHEWARKEGNHFVVGITDFGQACFKEITQVVFPNIGQFFRQKESFCVLESSKAANEVEMPLSGTVLETNHSLMASPEKINNHCYDEGWLIKIRASNELLEWQNLLPPLTYRNEIGVFFNKSK